MVDLFADSHLGDHSDVISDQLNNLWEMLTNGCDDPIVVRAEFHRLSTEVTNDWRQGLWFEWCGGTVDDPWEEIDRLNEENAHLRQQWSHLSLEYENLKAEADGLMMELELKTVALESMTDAFRHQDEYGRCQTCGDVMDL